VGDFPCWASLLHFLFSDLTLLGGRREGQLACKTNCVYQRLFFNQEELWKIRPVKLEVVVVIVVVILVLVVIVIVINPSPPINNFS